MIVADTNVWTAYLSGDVGDDVRLLDSALTTDTYGMAPMVQAELLSDPALTPEQELEIVRARALQILPGYRVRVGKLRATLTAKKLRPRLVDSMLAQICLDYDALFLSRDAGFRRFVSAGLKLHS